MRKPQHILPICIVAFMIAQPAGVGGVVEFTSFVDWQSAVGSTNRSISRNFRSSLPLHLITIITSLVFLFHSTPTTSAGVAEFKTFADWEAAAGDYQSITFTDFPKFTFITDQYESAGVIFLDGDDNIEISNAFPPDTFGLDGNLSITMEFTSPQHWFGVTFPGVVAIWLYAGETLIHTSVFKDFGDPGAFAGLVSDQPFDRAFLFDPIDPDVNIGDLYFGPPIPAPGSPAIFSLVACALFRRRRRR